MFFGTCRDGRRERAGVGMSPENKGVWMLEDKAQGDCGMAGNALLGSRRGFVYEDEWKTTQEMNG